MMLMSVRPPLGCRAHSHSGLVRRHEVDARAIQVRVGLGRTPASPQPDDTDDAGVAVDHDDRRNDQDVAGQEREVGFALPFGSVAGTLARQA